jgi:hypothetical protein
MENSKLYEVSSNMMDNLTKGCRWYFDTPEQRFKYTPESIWLINPNTKKWVLELEKPGKLYYHNEIYLTFKKYFNMEHSDFESFIKLWVEDALEKGVTTTSGASGSCFSWVEDALEKGVTTTHMSTIDGMLWVEDALKIGVSYIE